MDGICNAASDTNSVPGIGPGLIGAGVACPAAWAAGTGDPVGCRGARRRA